MFAIVRRMAMASAALSVSASTLALSASALAGQQPTVVVEVEAGPVWQGRNRVEIPNDGSASRFSLDELVGGGPAGAWRVYVTWNVASRHGLRLLAAPLSVSGSGVSERPLDFAGATYASGSPVAATYTFNSYRLTYRYRVRSGPAAEVWVGITAKIRDATVALEQGPTASRKDDLGFVPLLHLAASWTLGPGWALVVDADALAGGPGRAVDAAFEVERRLSDAWSIQLGYRTVEGGADVPEVYSFAWLHYATLSLAWRR